MQKEMLGRRVSKILTVAMAGYVFQEWTQQHFCPTCSWRTCHFLIKRWSLRSLPWTWRTVGVALTNRGSQSGAAWSPRLLEHLVHFPVALSQECTLGPESAWKKSLYSKVTLLERPQRVRERRTRYPGCSSQQASESPCQAPAPWGSETPADILASTLMAKMLSSFTALSENCPGCLQSIPRTLRHNNQMTTIILSPLHLGFVIQQHVTKMVVLFHGVKWLILYLLILWY